MKPLRNSVRNAMWVPQYASITIYGIGIQVNVTFPIKESLLPYLDFDSIDSPQGYYYEKNHKYYITEGTFIHFSDVKEGNDVVSMIANRANEMRLRLKLARRKAEVKLLNEEIKDAESLLKAKI